MLTLRGLVLGLVAVTAAPGGVIGQFEAPSATQAPTPGPSVPAGVSHTVLGTTWHDEFPDGRVELMRTTLERGAAMPPTRFDGSWFALVESGVLTASLVDGAAWIENRLTQEDESIERSDEVRLETGQLLAFGPDAVLVLTNSEQEPAPS